MADNSHTNDRRAELLKRHQTETANLEHELTILQLLPESLSNVNWSVYTHGLYDRVASIHARYDRYESIRKYPNPTLQVARDLAIAWPDYVPAVVYRDGSVGIRTAEQVAAMDEARTERAEIMRIAPFWIDIDAGISQVIDLRWMTRLPNVGIVDCHVTFTLHSPLMRAIGEHRLRFEYDRTPRRNVIGVLENTIALSREMQVFGNCSARVIRYSSGSNETPGHKLIYWELGDANEPRELTDDGRDYRPLTPVDMIDRLRELTKGEA